jgi:hypothetical protein
LRSLSRAASQNGGFLSEDFDMGTSIRLKKSVSDSGPMLVGRINNINNSELLLDVQENRSSGNFLEVFESR